MWLFWCLLSTIISGFVAVCIKKCSNNNPKLFAVLGLLIYHIIMVVFCLVLNPNLLFKININDIILLLPGIIIQSMGFYCAICSIKYGSVAITSSIKKTKVVIPFLLGIIILNEKCTYLQLLLSLIIVVLSIFLSKENDNKVEKNGIKKAIFYSYGFVLFNGLSNFLNKIYITHFNDALYVMFNYGLIIIFTIVLVCLITKKFSYIDIRKINMKKFFLLQALLDALSSIFDRFALLNGNISIISIISTCSIIITILASRIFLREKIAVKKYILILGIIICTIILIII